MIVTLNYHRYHGQNCSGKHAVKSTTSESEERRKGWARCKCPIVAYGTLDRVFRRMTTKQADWAAAAAMMAPYIAANSWDITPPPQPPRAPEPSRTPAPPVSGGVTIEDATKAYIAAHEKAQSAQMTIVGHRLRMTTIVNFAKQSGALTVELWTPDLVRQYLGEFDVVSVTAAKYHSIIKAFFAYCQTQKWIGENPAKWPTAIKNRATKIQKTGKQRYPFTNSDLERMYAGCRKYSRGLQWHGEDLADFIAVSVHTGLRISNVATFSADRLNGKDEVHVRTIKGDTMVYTVVPEWLADRIRIRAKKFGPMIFGSHTSERLDVITNGWRTRLIQLWKECGTWEVHPTPHRFRHTFARILLQSGRSYAEVAELMGDREGVVREHYAAWVPERQKQLSKMMRESFIDVPTPSTPARAKVLAIKR